MAGDCASGRAGGGGLVEAGWNRGTMYYYTIRAVFSHLSGVCI